MDHGFVTGGVAVWMKFAEHVAYGTRGFGKLGLAAEVQLAHGKDDAALDGFEAVGDVRERAVVDDVHGVVEVGAFGIRG